MTRLAICPQNHVWSLAGLVAETDKIVCPVCGSSGSTAAVLPTDGHTQFETLAPGAVPPVVLEVTLAPSPAVFAAAAATGGYLPELPGYEVLRELGHGGMGVVYLARHRELKRLVALKMILAEIHSDPGTKLRFQREAKAVARLQHPGIVQIHDVGEHAGRPFLALEYIDGTNLAGRLENKPFAPRIAAGLVEWLARTIHHAHERGVVHRDLTPRNILLARSTSSQAFRLADGDTEGFEPKITDFGLAKELDDDANQTQTGVIMGTPNYMAPEQALGRQDEIGPPTDIFSLGAILYELLTGRPPFLAETRLDVLRQVVEADPVPPTRLQPGVPRDLETICLKCLAKERARRYAGAGDLADDLQRFLANEPIRARPVSWPERGAKWARRHPAAAALLVVVLASLAALSVGSVAYSIRVRSERDRAEKNFEIAMQAVDELLSDVGEQQLAVEPRMEEKRRALLARAVKLHQEFLRQKSDDPHVRFETAQAHRRLADLFRLLEQHDPALESYGQAIALLERLHEQSPREARYRQQLAYCRNFSGEVLRAAGRHADAETAYRDADRLLQELASEFKDNPEYVQDRARTLYSLGILFRENQRLPDAEETLRQAAGLLADLVQRFPDDAGYQQHLARAYLNLGTAIRSPERQGNARSAYDRSIALLSVLAERFPDQPDYRHELGVACNNAGNLLAGHAEDLGKASAQHDRARALFQRLAADFPKVPVYRQELANTWNSIGNVESQKGDQAEALSAWKRAADLLEGLSREHPEVATYTGDLGMVSGNLGLASYAQSNLPESRAHLQRAVELLRKALAVSPKHAIYRDILRDNCQNLAEVLTLSGDHAAAAESARALAGVFPGSAKDRYFSACFLARCARLAAEDSQLGADQRQALAKSYADESLTELREAIEQGFDDLTQLHSDRESAFQAVESRSDFQALVARLSGEATKP
jgi:tetratricopeptide (TPR) repeat protein